MPRNTAQRTVLLAGATGLVGGACLQELLASPHFGEVIVIGRRHVAVTHAKLRQILTDFDHPPALPALAGGVFVCALGTTIKKAGSQQAFRRVDCEIPYELAEAAVRQGAMHAVLVSSVGADANAPNFYLRVKGEVEEGFRGLGYRGVDIFRPSFLLGNRGESRLGERVAITVARTVEWMLMGPLERYRPVEAADVARAMRIAAERALPGEHIWHWREIRNAQQPPVE